MRETSFFLLIVEECWDHDAEARLSSSCVHERLSLMKTIIASMNTVNEDEVHISIPLKSYLKLLH